MSEKSESFETLRGKFLVLDGPDGAGKSTIAKRVAQRLCSAGLTVQDCRDPGGTCIGDRIRGVLLDHDLSDMAVGCEVLLFMASRAQLLHEVIHPALKAGNVVLCDRFVSSTVAYQGACGARPEDILDLARHAIGDTWPDLTIVLDVRPDVGFDRISRDRTPPGAAAGEGLLDGMERRSRDFHETVRANFLELPAQYPTPVEIVDASVSLDEVVDAVLACLDRFARGTL